MMLIFSFKVKLAEHKNVAPIGETGNKVKPNNNKKLIQ